MNKGTIIRVSILRGTNLLPEHYGIYDGDGWVYHFTGDSIGNARIKFTTLKDFEKGGIAYIENVYGARYDVEEIIRRASSQVGSDFGGYNLLKNNCEHFAYWCVTGIRQSRQTFNMNPEDDKRDVVEKTIDAVFDPLMLVGKALDKKLGLEDKVGEERDVVEKAIDVIFNPLIKLGHRLDNLFKL
ncbi:MULTISPECIES: lecithin retinol acyltransferase family protein [Bacillus cereus group]|uniref:lecithin retinol acyltransferase family protein n=1 Tax=Bacillus cereus group TaxID=86661 RepID=UPI001E4BDD9E|nr:MULTISPECIES: lecithin retinol acyltransferase family protein [Bacillus cereus group]MDA1897683.1 lecithin retinol acyltransferase family protein [Bacillus cereus group sp. BcHK28]MDA1902901.1 lecithin retinol acyltransferase family protein [Bacillus cereus group sp. BcHK20]MDF0737747.1 lecithin retinol acyltransferase family protein [Bacillus pacificus]MDG1650661.1 lecithin retinol acyltransferase family protein [Bacillus pacificus]UEP94728.1 lecithin retinol acyltransferase family protein